MINYNKGLTLTVVIEGQSLNFGEGFGNVATLKKLKRGNGNEYVFSSRQSLRYSIVKIGNESFNWKLAKVSPEGSGENKVVQFSAEENITTSTEIDLFGYMKTKKKGSGEGTATRIAPVRLTPAIALEPFNYEVEFQTNKWLADRAGENPNIANAENHRSLYKYTVTVDLDRVGTECWNLSLPEEERKLEIEPSERYKRISELLDTIKYLYRDIRGRREDLKPLFVVGGVFNIKNPFFMNAILIDWKDEKPSIDLSPINEIYENLGIKEHERIIGARKGYWENEFKNNISSPEEAIEKMKKKVEEVYLEQ
jgi:CRISPR-associated protein Cst2